MSDRKPLVGLVGTIGRDPERKTTGKGEIVVTSLAVNDGFGDDAKTDWYNLAIWNDGLQQQAIGTEDTPGQIYKGAQVAIQGTVSQRDGYQPDVNVVRLGIVTWLPRSKGQQQTTPQPAADEDVDF